MLKRLVLIGACLAATFSTAALAAESTYVVGSGGTYRPFEFENSQKQLEGFDIDIIKAVAKAEGFQIKLINTPWEDLRHVEFRRSRHHHFRHHHHRQAQTNG